MSTHPDSIPAQLPRAESEVVRLIRQIQALALGLEGLRRRGTSATELQAGERALEQLRWRLAAAAKRAASRDSRSIA